MFAILGSLLIYWLVLFVVCFTIVEVGWDQLYDDKLPQGGLKVALGSFILAALLTWLHPTFESMFTTNIAWTVLQAIVWFAVFTLAFQFHPPHAAALGILTMLIVPGVATMGVDSVTKPRPRTASTTRAINNEPVRKSLGPVPGAAIPKK